MPFPEIDPVLFQFGPVAIRWYGLAYFFGIIFGLALASYYTKRYSIFMVPPAIIEDFGLWATLAIIVGGRLGSVVLYNFDFYIANPLQIFMVANGGMSFHGGFAGVALTVFIFCRVKKLKMLDLSDIVACVAPIGLAFGRVANFVNGELWGRPTSLPWGMVFPNADEAPRHPSQLYEAALEGVVLFVVLNLMIRNEWVRLRSGLLTGVFVSGYGVMRFFVEFTREPDASLIGAFSRGQIYSVPMIIIGIAFIVHAALKPKRGTISTT